MCVNILNTLISHKRDAVKTASAPFLSYRPYSTVTLFARFLGLSTSSPLATEI